MRHKVEYDNSDRYSLESRSLLNLSSLKGRFFVVLVISMLRNVRTR